MKDTAIIKITVDTGAAAPVELKIKSDFLKNAKSSGVMPSMTTCPATIVASKILEILPGVIAELKGF